MFLHKATIKNPTSLLGRVVQNTAVESTKDESAQLQQKLAVRQAGNEKLARLRAKIEEMQMMFPASLSAKINSTDSNVTAELVALGELLILTGTQSKGA